MKPTVIPIVRKLAAQGHDVATIRRRLMRRFKPASVHEAIRRVRQQGDLPPAVKKNPERLTLLLPARTARRLETLAGQAEMRPSQWARAMIQRAIAAQPRGTA